MPSIEIFLLHPFVVSEDKRSYCGVHGRLTYECLIRTCDQTTIASLLQLSGYDNTGP